MAERPDLIILGGDYVTWGGDGDHDGRSRVRRARRRCAQAAVGTPRRLRRARQSRRRSRHAGRDGGRGVEMLRDARTRFTIRGETLDLIGIRYWTTRARDIANRRARRCRRVDSAGAQSVAPERGGRARRPAHAERPHARRPDRPAGHRGDGRAGTFQSSRVRARATQRQPS